MEYPDVNFKIIALDKERGQITVKFYDENMEVDVAIDLPVQDGALLDLRGEALTNHIRGFCPIAEFIRRRAFLAGSDYSYLESLVDVSPVIVAPVGPPAQSVLPVVEV